MAPYSVSFKPSAQRELRKLPRQAIPALNQAISDLSDQPRPHGCIKLAGKDEWRIRVGTYRVIYRIDDDESRVWVISVGHRSRAYDDL